MITGRFLPFFLTTFISSNRRLRCMEYEKIRRYADLAHIGRSDQMLTTDFGRLRGAVPRQGMKLRPLRPLYPRKINNT